MSHSCTFSFQSLARRSQLPPLPPLLSHHPPPLLAFRWRAALRDISIRSAAREISGLLLPLEEQQQQWLRKAYRCRPTLRRSRLTHACFDKCIDKRYKES
ncbi:hypothetical protein GUJ93_ZPchr0013g35213 [Zizania palustris]|uniref:Uncharacterized protein n=1 Tax=Zizania palustris TaxID=103762 RepID=A0A8J5X6Z6_ZIZPA|nr:hypothetical protein GUJ93_ZPchr0013g35213 [Zizania palustris]